MKEGRIVVSIIVLIIAILSVIFLFNSVYYDKPTDMNKNYETDSYRFCREHKRIANHTGLPTQYTCDEIKTMIFVDFYPRTEKVYECQNHPDAEWKFSGSISYTDPDKFKKYYILNCLEMVE